MDQRPYRYRIEHRDGDLAAVIRCFLMTDPPARQALRLEATRLELEGVAGRVVLIDQEAEPEREVATIHLATQSVSEPTEPAT